MKKKYGLILFIFILLTTILIACEQDGDMLKGQAKKVHQQAEKPDRVLSPKDIEHTITIGGIGDVLLHSTVYRDAKTGNGYNFEPMLKQVKPFLEKPTITFANQESMMGGADIGLSTYPQFNSPYEIGDTLKNMGIDVVSMANNHTLDRGDVAIQNAIEHWDDLGIMYVGSYKSVEDQDTLRIYQTDAGISVAFLAYTYGTNGIPLPEDKPYLVNYIDKENIKEEVEHAQKKADVVILSLHYGVEYIRKPNERQKDLVQFAADLGVDVVLGHHPHVLQPMKWVEGKNGNEMLAVYSLGNFLSGQRKFYQRVGGMVEFSIKQSIIDGEKRIEVLEPKFLPTYVVYDHLHNFRVVPMYQLTDQQLPHAQEKYVEIKEHMSQWLPELKFMGE